LIVSKRHPVTFENLVVVEEVVAFSHSAQLVLLANVGLVVLALLLVLALPRRIPDRSR
jgi:hypothetical protein